MGHSKSILVKRNYWPSNYF